MENKICQSCGMPMDDNSFGTNANMSKNKEYCHYCFKLGKFTDEGIIMEDKIKKNIAIAVKIGLSESKARTLAESTIPKLKRWKKKG
jgi:hypothetical protein